MPTYKLIYFDAPTSRGEECRLALHIAGIPFFDERIKDWPGRKASTPFGALPVLMVEGHPPIAQSNAILRLIGSQHDLLPADPWESARHEAIMGAVEDLRARLTPISRIRDPEERKRQREELAAGYMREWAANVERQVGDGPFVGGAKISVADVKIFVVMTPFLKGAIDHISPDVFNPFPKLLRLHEAVKSHPRVVDWYNRAR
jgi:prostaglandin-H2 D-isomerase / glutathione transferase